MLINADFSQRVIITPQQYQWVVSPQSGVERVMLDRIGGEKARATSFVRYAPGSYFPPHRHPSGEEILVLSGVFSEENAHYSCGWYLRNPPGSQHQPYSKEGALIFVKLCQMPPLESHSVRINTTNPDLWQRQDEREVCPLFSSKYEDVSLQRLKPNAALFMGSNRTELLILAGEIVLEGKNYTHGSWLRFPAGDCPNIIAGENGVTVYLKTRHLLDSVINTQ